MLSHFCSCSRETEYVTEITKGTVLKIGDKLKLNQSYRIQAMGGLVTLPVDTEVEVLANSDPDYAISMKIGDSVYDVYTASFGTGFFLNSVCMRDFNGEDVLCFSKNQLYLSSAASLEPGDGLLKGASGNVYVQDDEQAKMVRSIDLSGTILFYDGTAKPLPEGRYNGWRIAEKDNYVYTVEPYFYEIPFQITVPEGMIVEGCDGNTANIGDTITFKSKKLYCVSADTNKTVADMVRDDEGYYCCTINRVIGEVSAAYRKVVTTKEELLQAEMGDFFTPSEGLEIVCASGENQFYSIFVDGCIRTWEENGETKTIFAEKDRKNGGEWTRSSANGYQESLRFNGDGTIQAVYNGVAETSMPAINLSTPGNGWVVKKPLYYRNSYTDANGNKINRYSISLYGAEYTPEAVVPAIGIGTVLHTGDTFTLTGELDYPERFDFLKNSIPAGTEVTFAKNTDPDYFWCPYAWVYSGVVSPIAVNAIQTPEYETPVCMLDTLVVSGGTPLEDTGFNLQTLRRNVVFGKRIETDAFYTGDVLAGVAGDSMFDRELQFQMEDGQIIAAWGIDAAGNWINADHQIVYPSQGQNAWQITGQETIENSRVFAVVPYTFAQQFAVTAGEGIEVTGTDNGTIPAFGSLTFRSKRPMRVEYQNKVIDIRDMLYDADGYYTLEIPAVTNPVLVESAAVITDKEGLRNAKEGDLFMPTEDFTITEADTWFDQFMVSLCIYEYEVAGGQGGVVYDQKDADNGVIRGIGGVMHVYTDGSVGYTETEYDGTVVTRRFYPATAEDHKSNCWIIDSIHDQNWSSDPGNVCYTMKLYGIDTPYIYHTAVAATCTEDGNVAHWEDLAGRCFADEAGRNLLTSVAETALGHAYQAEYTWKKSNNTYYCTAKLTCSNDDTHVIYIDLDVENEGNVYTAVGQYDTLVLADTYTVEVPSYQISVQNGVFTQWQDMTITVDAATKITVCADEPVPGYYFAGWYADDGTGEVLMSKNTTYTFFAAEDVTLTAKYAAEESVFDDNDVTGNVECTRVVKSADKDTVVIKSSFSVSNTNYAIKQVGYVYAAGEWNNETMTLEAEGIRNKYMTCDTYNAYYTFNLNLSRTAFVTIRPYYIVYNWKTGQEEQIVYEDVIIVAPNR